MSVATCETGEPDPIDSHGDQLGEWSEWMEVLNNSEWVYRERECKQCGQLIQESRPTTT